jgi:hypothetical protein
MSSSSQSWRSWRRRALLAIAVCLVREAAFGADAAARTIHVDPRAAGQAGAGTAESPLGSIREALALAAGLDELSVILAPGAYRDTDERFPLRVPGRLKRLRLIGSETGECVIQVPPELDGPALQRLPEPAFDSGADPEVGTLVVDFELRRVHVAGGDVGLSLVAGAREKGQVTIEAASFSEQKFAGVELVAACREELQVTVAECEFSGAPLFALDLATRPLGKLGLTVRDCRFAGRASEFPIRGGIAVFLDQASVIRGRIERNRLRDMGDAVHVSSSNRFSAAGALELDLVNNTIIGGLQDGKAGMRHGLYLSLFPHHLAHLRLWNNTLAGGSGHAIFQTAIPLAGGAADFGALCESFRLEAKANVVYGFGSGDWSLEPGGEDVAGIEFPPACANFEGNALTSRRLSALAGNLMAREADFVDPSGADFRLAAASRLIDRHPAGVSAGQRIIGDWDQTRRCRFVDGDNDGIFQADLGSLEFDGGACLSDLRPFRRGDCTSDGDLNIADAVRSFNFLFIGGADPDCLDACDANDDGTLNIADGITVLGFLFLGFDPLPPPFPDAGFDPTPDAQHCLR